MIKPATKVIEATRRGEMLDWVFLGIFGLVLIGLFVIAYRWDPHITNPVTNIIVSVGESLLAGYPVLKMLSALDKFIRRHWITSYAVEMGDDVIKVLGPVPVLDLEYVRSRLLAMRPNYMMVDNAFELFGCTMAAVPASETHLIARRKLSALGIKI